MKRKIQFTFKSILFTLLVFLLNTQAVLAQDALTSVKTNIQNVRMSSDKKTISYDIYYQDVDPTYPVEIPGYLFRLAVPQADIGTSAKTVTVTNANAALGVTAVSITVSGSNWIMKFLNGNFISTYAGGLLASETFPGTLLGTFNIQNTDGTSFADPQIFNATYSGTSPILKSTVSIFLKDQVVLTPNTSTAQPITNFTGLGLYSLTVPVTPVTITGVTASNKIYDGTATAILSGGTLSGVTSGDVVTLVAGTGTFADKNSGSGKAVTATGYSLGGTDAAKYTLSAQPTGLTASITTAPVSIAGVTASNKIYNGTTTGTLTGGSLTGVLGSDVVTLVAGTGSFTDKKAGIAKTVTATGYSISGASASNYTLITQPAGLKANITTAPVTITGITTSNKVYDGSSIATLTGGTLVGSIIGDVVTLFTGIGTFSDKNIGLNKAVTASGYSIGGADASNYVLSAQPAGLTANITASSTALSITGVTVGNKIYDGSTVATLSGGTLLGVFSGDVVTLIAGTGSFTDKNIGTGKTVTATGYSITGANASNYTLSTQPTALTASITAAPLSITGVSANNKVYNGTTTGALTGGSLTGVLSGDVVTLVAGTGLFADKKAGAAKIVSATGYSISGANASNYTLSAQPTGLTASITTAPLTIFGVTASNKAYDGSPVASLTGGSLVDVAIGDVVTFVAGTGAFADKNSGTNKAVTATGYSISGTDASNYLLIAQPGGLTASITALPLTVSAPTITLSKIYDGTITSSIITGTLSGVLVADKPNLILAATAVYDNSSVGTGKTITVSYVLTGSASVNYSAPVGSSILNGVILAIPKQLTVKVYLEGLWNSLSKNMNKSKKWDVGLNDIADAFGGTVVDTVSVVLHDPNLYATILYQAHGLELNQDGSIHTPGKLYIEVPGGLSGGYRLTVMHRNHLETTSSSAVSFAGSSVNYDFTDAVSKAYQSDPSMNPTKEVAPGKWMFYAGEIHIGSFPEITDDDLYKTFGDRSGDTGIYGYELSDLDGSGTVDDGDIYLLFNNRGTLLYIP